MFLVKWEESRNFDVFFMCFLCLKEKKDEQKMSRKSTGTKGDLSILVWRVPGAFYSTGMLFEAAALVRPPPPKGHGLGWSWHPWKDFDFLFLKRHGSWKSNDRIESYGSRKLMVHRLVRYPGSRDISAVLTLIVTHE